CDSQDPAHPAEFGFVQAVLQASLLGAFWQVLIHVWRFAFVPEHAALQPALLAFRLHASRQAGFSASLPHSSWQTGLSGSAHAEFATLKSNSTLLPARSRANTL